MADEITGVGVVGLGTMGAGIAEVFARSGLDVVGVERDAAALAAGQGHVRHSTDRAVRRNKLSPADQEALIGRITFTTDLADLAGVDLVVEAVPERIELKRELFGRLDSVVGPQTVLATNTSSLSVTEISVASARPNRVLGMHFFNPAPVQDLVEVVRTVVTAPEVVDQVTALARRLGKVPVECGDKAGFITNALLFGYLNRAAAMYETGYATREDIDAAMTLGCGYPMGPLALLDLIGLDTAYEVLDTMYKQGRDRLHAPAPILEQLVTAGLRGRKSGRGFYTYAEPDSPVVVPDAATPADGGAGSPGREIRRAGVVGSGAAAASVAELLAEGGYEVVVTDGVDAGLAEVELVVEADDVDGAPALFEALDKICAPGTILAASSALPVIRCAAATSRPADVVGMHLAGGVVEVVRTVVTAGDVAASVAEVCRRGGKQPVSCGDRAGFIVDALLFPYLNDAVKMLEAHYASIDDIDAAMKLGCRLPLGPFELLDEVGLDVALRAQRRLYREVREPGLAPAPLLEHLVTAGRPGRAGGRGFRDHP